MSTKQMPCDYCGKIMTVSDLTISIICGECTERGIYVGKGKHKNTVNVTNDKSSTSTKYGSGYTYKKCWHDGDIQAEPLYSAEGKELYIGGTDSKALGFQFVIDCASIFAGKTSDEVVTIAPTTEMKDVLNSLTMPFPQRLALKWKDFSVAPVLPEFWSTLWEYLPQGKTLICCQGGHGRSGVAFSSLVIATSNHTNRWAVNLLRAKHCRQSVETAGQEKYLKSLYEYYKGLRQSNG